jgi:hypothetical protein
LPCSSHRPAHSRSGRSLAKLLRESLTAQRKRTPPCFIERCCVRLAQILELLECPVLLGGSIQRILRWPAFSPGVAGDETIPAEQTVTAIASSAYNTKCGQRRSKQILLDLLLMTRE